MVNIWEKLKRKITHTATLNDQEYLAHFQCLAYEWRLERAKRYKVDYIV